MWRSVLAPMRRAASRKQWEADLLGLIRSSPGWVAGGAASGPIREHQPELDRARLRAHGGRGSGLLGAERERFRPMCRRAATGRSEAGHFDYTCALTKSGDLRSVGDRRIDRCRISPPGRFVALSAGLSHACELTPDGEAACWGTFGGTWSKEDHGPVTPPAGLDIRALRLPRCLDRARMTHAGRVVCWGDTEYSLAPGARPIRLRTSSSTPQRVSRSPTTPTVPMLDLNRCDCYESPADHSIRGSTAYSVPSGSTGRRREAPP